MTGVRRALIVATGTYLDQKFRELRAPAADAERLAEVLRDPTIGDFAVDVALDQDEGTLRRRIARFFGRSDREDVLLLHVSGHGVKDAHGVLYLAASDTEVDLLDATAVPAQWLDDQISRSPSRRKLLLLDCCFSGKFPFNVTARATDSVDVEERFQGRGRAVITASNAMEYAYEGDQFSGEGKPSYFTAALIQALETGEADRDQDEWISVDELYDYVFDRVREVSPHQTPTRQIALEGPLYVARSKFKRPVEPAKLDDQLVQLAEHPLPGARLGAVDELERLMTSPNAGVALAAQQILEGMVDDDSRRVATRVTQALEEQARREAEEQARREAEEEEARRHADEEQARQQAEEEARGEGEEDKGRRAVGPHSDGPPSSHGTRQERRSKDVRASPSASPEAPRGISLPRRPRFARGETGRGTRGMRPLPQATLPRRGILWAAAALLAVLGIAFGVLLLLGGRKSENVVDHPIRVSRSADDVAVNDGAVWVANDSGVRAYDVSSGRPIGDSIRTVVTSRGKGLYSDLAAGEGSVWVAHAYESGEDPTLTQIDSRSKRILDRSVPLRKYTTVFQLEVGYGGLWVAAGVGGLQRIHSVGAKPAAARGINESEGVAIGEGAIWSFDYDRGLVTKVDPLENRAIGRPIQVGGTWKGTDNQYGEIAAGAGSVWVWNDRDDALSRLDPGSGREVSRVRLPSSKRYSAELEVGAGFVWLTNPANNSVMRIDPRSSRITGPPARLFSDYVGRMAIGEGAVWTITRDRRRTAIAPIDPRTGRALGFARGRLAEPSLRAPRHEFAASEGISPRPTTIATVGPSCCFPWYGPAGGKLSKGTPLSRRPSG